MRQTTLMMLVVTVPLLMAGRCDEDFSAFQDDVAQFNDQAGPIAAAVESWLPPPFDLILKIAGGASVLLAGKRHIGNRSNARSIARAFEAVKAKTGGVVDFNSPEAVALLNSVMTKGAKRLVDEAQGKKRSSPL